MYQKSWVRTQELECDDREWTMHMLSVSRSKAIHENGPAPRNNAGYDEEEEEEHYFQPLPGQCGKSACAYNKLAFSIKLGDMTVTVAEGSHTSPKSKNLSRDSHLHLRRWRL